MRRFRGNPDWRASILWDYALAFALMTAATALILYFWGP